MPHTSINKKICYFSYRLPTNYQNSNIPCSVSIYSHMQSCITHVSMHYLSKASDRVFTFSIEIQQALPSDWLLLLFVFMFCGREAQDYLNTIIIYFFFWFNIIRQNEQQWILWMVLDCVHILICIRRIYDRKWHSLCGDVVRKRK